MGIHFTGESGSSDLWLSAEAVMDSKAKPLQVESVLAAGTAGARLSHRQPCKVNYLVQSQHVSPVPNSTVWFTRVSGTLALSLVFSTGIVLNLYIRTNILPMLSLPTMNKICIPFYLNLLKFLPAWFVVFNVQLLQTYPKYFTTFVLL